ncbi:hypothetical protein L3X38_042577 [Prunus dulcis]|uniref:Polymerase/histidinol phosphatase N-terminal domain-containing protein n=1 Tax=Prunus dulcis TaxID=3755 RepID=A0AAD4YM38_PRUDU|nr:hypothetical protein L3X38_042577 [Prunus dulcis]
MVGDGFIINHSTNSSNKLESPKKTKKKKKRGGTKKKMTTEQTLAFKSVSEWVFLEQASSLPSTAASCVVDDFGVQKSLGRGGDKVVFELHSHSKCSDGFLSPSKLVERAHGNGVKVLALTDHDTMSGIPEALEAARRFRIKIIPGVEISTKFYPRGDSEPEEPVHILAYYSSCGPTSFEDLEKFLSNIRDGRYLRAKTMVSKLNMLKLPVKWEHVSRIAGKGVAPGRLHVARALVEAGYVENLKQAFSRYLFDGGPAYSTGSEPLAEEAIQMICDTGEVMENWLCYSDLAETYDLLKLGGSDYHGRGGHGESELGSVNLPVLVLRDFLKVARPIWCRSIRHILENYAEEPSDFNLAKITRLKLSHVSINQGGIQVPVESK